ncbi:MAG: hypothetical protein KDD73_05815 [Anaerolineales bacterium]|nr:hypothetical protein [Anaerolineales bacterium]
MCKDYDKGGTNGEATRGRARRPRAVGHGGPRSGTAARGRARRPDPTGTHKQ